MDNKYKAGPEFGHLDHFGKEKVYTINRRIDHLSERIAQSPSRKMDFDRMELSALVWALKQIES